MRGQEGQSAGKRKRAGGGKRRGKGDMKIDVADDGIHLRR
jgi:hypothetical protein